MVAQEPERLCHRRKRQRLNAVLGDETLCDVAVDRRVFAVWKAHLEVGNVDDNVIDPNLVRILVFVLILGHGAAAYARRRSWARVVATQRPRDHPRADGTSHGASAPT